MSQVEACRLETDPLESHTSCVFERVVLFTALGIMQTFWLSRLKEAKVMRRSLLSAIHYFTSRNIRRDSRDRFTIITFE